MVDQHYFPHLSVAKFGHKWGYSHVYSVCRYHFWRNHNRVVSHYMDINIPWTSPLNKYPIKYPDIPLHVLAHIPFKLIWKFIHRFQIFPDITGYLTYPINSHCINILLLVKQLNIPILSHGIFHRRCFSPRLRPLRCYCGPLRAVRRLSHGSR